MGGGRGWGQGGGYMAATAYSLPCMAHTWGGGGMVVAAYSLPCMVHAYMEGVGVWVDWLCRTWLHSHTPAHEQPPSGHHPSGPHDYPPPPPPSGPGD